MSEVLEVNWATAARALLWEFCRRGWWRILNAQIAILGLAAIVYSSLLRVGPLDPQAGRSLHLVLLWILFVATGGAALAAHGDPGRFYLLPLSNWALAAATMLPGFVIVAGTYALTAGILNGLYGVGWPIVGPAIFLGASLGAIQVATRIAGIGRVRQFVVWCLVAILFEHWLRVRYGGGSFLSPRAMWTGVSFAEWIALGTMTSIEFLLMVHGIGRNRRGDRALLSVISSWPVRRSRKSARTLPRFTSPKAAQFWFEWKQKGLILPGTFAFFAVLLIAGYLLRCFENGEYELLHCCMGYGMGLGPIALIAGLVLGHSDFSQGNVECGSFLATRPATNTALSAALLKVEAASVLLTWGLWTAFMIGATALLYYDQGSEPVLDLWTDHGKYSHVLASLGSWYAALLVGMCLVFAWIPLALASSLAQTGRQRMLVTIVAGSVPSMLLVLFVVMARVDGRVILPDEIWRIAIGGAAVVVTSLGFATARRQGLISKLTCRAALAGWLALCGLAGCLSWLVGPWNSSFVLLTAGTLALPFAPLASGPLALSWNRHR